jgi:hypothetical protein
MLFPLRLCKQRILRMTSLVTHRTAKVCITGDREHNRSPDPLPPLSLQTRSDDPPIHDGHGAILLGLACRRCFSNSLYIHFRQTSSRSGNHVTACQTLLLPLLCAITHTLTPKSASISTPRATCPRALQNWVTKPLSVPGRCRRLSRSTRRHLAAHSPHPSSRSHSLITPLPSTSVPTPRNPTTLP